MPPSFTPIWQMTAFRLVLAAVVLFLQWTAYRHLVRWAREHVPTHPWVRHVITGAFLLFNGALLVVFILRPQPLDFPPWFRILCMYPFFIWFAATIFLGVVFLVVDLLALPFRIALWGSRKIAPVRSRLTTLAGNTRFRQFDASRRLFLRRGLEGATIAAFGGSAYGIFIGNEETDLTDAEFAFPGLHPGLDGFTIALVSDVHSSAFMTPDRMDEFVTMLNGMGADMIVVAGDFVTGSTEEVYPFARSFRQLHAPHGVYGVMGNHDFYVSSPDTVASEVERAGIRLLRDQNTLLRRSGGLLNVIGVDDVGPELKAEEAIARARRGIVPHAPTILLCHRPYHLPQASAAGVDLMLSGHTHGGQVVLASIGSTAITPAALASPYLWGTYHKGKTAMYVSRGVGTVGIPVRLNCPPELTKITLRRGPRKSKS